MKRFGAVRTYLPQWLAAREARAQQVERAVREREEQLRDAYEHARRQEAHRLIAGTPPEELSAIEQEATAPWKREHGDLPMMPAISARWCGSRPSSSSSTVRDFRHLSRGASISAG
jgi:hypothetical protein